MSGSRMLGAALGLSALLFSGGCVRATFVPTGTVAAPRPTECGVQVFSSALPERPYEEIGIVEGEGKWWKSDLEDILPKLTEAACLAGGDALILVSNNLWAEGEHGSTRVQRVYGTVVRWKAEN